MKENVGPASTALAYSTCDRLVADFASRGLVILSPESLGIPSDVHRRIYEQEFSLHKAKKPVTPASIPDIFEVINSPGVVAACNQLVGKNWAIVPFTHNAPFTSGPRDQHWHKDDNGPYNSRKQRHHQAVQIEFLYYPQAVDEAMGPTAVVPYSHYWAFNHEENQDNFAGADHLDFNYQLSGMERESISGPDSKYDREDIARGRTNHDVRMKEAVTNLQWPLVKQVVAAPLRAGSVVIYSHNTFHRGNHRRDDWRTWDDHPRFKWRFWVYRTTDPSMENRGEPEEASWNHVDALTHVDLSVADDDVTSVWRYHTYWMQTGQAPPPRSEVAGLSKAKRKQEADRLFAQLHLKHDEAEPARIGAAYKLASVGDSRLAVRLLGKALYDERESVRRAATYGLIAAGEASTDVLLKATTSPVKWVRKAGVYGLGDAALLSEAVLKAVVDRLRSDPSVYVRSVAAGTLGCLGRRAVANGVGRDHIPACFEALAQCLGREENRLSMDRVQKRSIKFVRPTDACDVCEGGGVDFGLARFAPVRSAVRENALWALVILCSHGAAVAGSALGQTLEVLEEVIRSDQNVICVGFAMDALNRLVHLNPSGEAMLPFIGDLKGRFLEVLGTSPVQSWESLVRGGLRYVPISNA